MSELQDALPVKIIKSSLQESEQNNTLASHITMP